MGGELQHAPGRDVPDREPVGQRALALTNGTGGARVSR